MNICRYCSISWLTCSVCPSVCRWHVVDNLVLMLRILFSCFINLAANWGPQFDRAVLGRPCSFQTWFLKRAASPLWLRLWYGLVQCEPAFYGCNMWQIEHWIPALLGSVVMSFQDCKVASLGLSFLAGSSGNDFILWHWSHPTLVFSTPFLLSEFLADT